MTYVELTERASARGSGIGYRGPDRRCTGRGLAEAAGPASVVGLSVLAVPLVSAAIVALSGHSVATTGWLTASAAVLAAVAAAIHVARWRLTGHAPALWLGSGLLVYSAASMAFPGLVATAEATAAPVLSGSELLRAVATLVVLVLIGMALRAPTIDAGLDLRRVVAVAAVAAVVGGIAVSTSVAARTVLGPPLDRAPAGDFATSGQLVVTLVWLGLALGFARRVERAGDVTVWIVLMLVGLAGARACLAFADGHSPWLVSASQLCRLVAVSAGLAGALLGLQRSFTTQRRDLHHSVESLRTERERTLEARAEEVERAHDLRGALAGIGAATALLEEHEHRLSPADRAEIANAVKGEIARLQRVVDRRVEDPAPVPLTSTLEPVLRSVAADRVVLAVDLPERTAVAADPKAVVEIVEHLVDHARRHAPRSPVTVSARADDGTVAIRVEDRGPGIPAADHDLVFERGAQLSDGSVSGLDLYVAARLARRQGGRLWVEDRDGGGASFVLLLPEAIDRSGR